MTSQQSPNLPSIKAEEFLLSGPDVKKHLDANFVRMLFERHAGLDKKYIAQFLHRAQLSGADPRQDQIYLIERNNKVKSAQGDVWQKVGIIVYSYGFTLGVVQSHKEYCGMTTKIEVRDRYIPKTRPGQYGKPELDPEGGVIVKKELCAVTHVQRANSSYEYVAWITDYYQNTNPKWVSSPDTMLRKCAEVAACRHAFADIVQGFYAKEEIESAMTDQIVEEQKDGAIEAEKVTAAVASSVHAEEIMTRDQQVRASHQIKLINSINILTAGKSLQEKGEWMLEHVGVASVKAIASMSDALLTKRLCELDAKLEGLGSEEDVYSVLKQADKERSK